MWLDFSVVMEFPKDHTWSSKAVTVAAGPQGRCSDSLLCDSGHGESIGFLEVIPTDCWGLPDLSKQQKKLFIVLQLYWFHVLFSHSYSTFIMLELLASKPVMIAIVFDSHKIKILLSLISPPAL